MFEHRFPGCDLSHEQTRDAQALGSWTLGGIAVLWVSFAFWFDPDQKILDTFHTDHFIAHALPALLPAWGAWALRRMSQEVRFDAIEQPLFESPWWTRHLPRLLVAAALLYTWLMLFMGVAQLGSQPGVPYAGYARLAAALAPGAVGIWLAWRSLTSDPEKELKLALAALSALLGLAIAVVAAGVYLSFAGWEVGYDWITLAIALGTALPMQLVAAALLPTGFIPKPQE